MIHSLKTLAAKKVITTNSGNQNFNLPTEVKETMEEIKERFFLLRALEQGTKRSHDEDIDSFVDYIKICAIESYFNVQYLIYNIRNANDSNSRKASGKFWSEVMDEIEEKIDKVENLQQYV